MMAQKDMVVVGIDVAKDKLDSCIRAHALRQTFPEHRTGPPQAGWLASQASGWQGGDGSKWRLRARLAKLLREAGIEVRIVDPKRVRSFALSAGRLAKNDAIDAEMIAWLRRSAMRRLRTRCRP